MRPADARTARRQRGREERSRVVMLPLPGGGPALSGRLAAAPVVPLPAASVTPSPLPVLTLRPRRPRPWPYGRESGECFTSPPPPALASADLRAEPRRSMATGSASPPGGGDGGGVAAAQAFAVGSPGPGGWRQGPRAAGRRAGPERSGGGWRLRSEDGGCAERAAAVQHAEEGDRGEGGRGDLRRVLLAQERQDQLCHLGVSGGAEAGGRSLGERAGGERKREKLPRSCGGARGEGGSAALRVPSRCGERGGRPGCRLLVGPLGSALEPCASSLPGPGVPAEGVVRAAGTLRGRVGHASLPRAAGGPVGQGGLARPFGKVPRTATGRSAPLPGARRVAGWGRGLSLAFGLSARLEGGGGWRVTAGLGLSGFM